MPRISPFCAHAPLVQIGKALRNFQRERDKFSPKKKREPIHRRDKMVLCPAHDKGKNRKCIGKGCKHFEAKYGDASKGARRLTRRDLRLSFSI